VGCDVKVAELFFSLEKKASLRTQNFSAKDPTHPLSDHNHKTTTHPI
jgi:hypothetical protein